MEGGVIFRDTLSNVMKMSLTNPLMLFTVSTVMLLGIVTSDSITLTSCGDPATSLVKVKKFEYSPNPVTFPGDITFNVEFDVLQDIVAPVAVNTVIEVSSNGRVLKIPCINGVGSCYHSDICEKLATNECPDFFTKHNLQCQCPFQKGTVSISDVKVPIPLGQTKGENYHVKVEVQTNNVFAFCLDIHAIHDS